MALGFQPRGLFGRKPMLAGIVAGEQPPMDMGDFSPMPKEMPKQQASPQPSGLSGGNGLRALAGTIGDTLLQYNGMGPVYAPTMQAQQEAAAKQREASLKHEQDWTDYVRKQEYEAAHPKPVNNDTVADYEFIRQNLGDEAAKTYLQNRADPPQYRQGPDGQFYRVQTGQGGMPTAPVGKLTPITPGGPTPQASGTFRPY